MNSSQDPKIKFNEAFSSMQADLPTAQLNANNPFFKSKYANLDELVRVSRPVLAKYGFSVTQGMSCHSSSRTFWTKLKHKDGFEEISEYPIEPSKPGIQEIGKEITYLRRYMYACIVGVITSNDPEDDDGESAMRNNRQNSSSTQQNDSSNANLISSKQLDALIAQLEKIEKDFQKDIAHIVYKQCDVHSFVDIPLAKFDVAMSIIKQAQKV